MSALQIKLATSAPSATSNARTRNPKAYAQYLIGRHEVDFVEVDLHRAIAHFDTAIAIDSTFAAAYAGISLAWSYLADEYLAPDSSYPQMKAAALKAVQLDSMSADAHTALALALMWKDFNVKGAIAEFERAVALDPNSADVREIYANVLFAAHPSAGVAQADRALALDPLSGFASYMRAACLYGARRYREAIEQAKHTEELTPNLVYYDVVDAASMRELKDYRAAVARYTQAQPFSNKPLFGLGVTYARMELRDSALRVAHDLEKYGKTHYVTPSLIAMIYANLPAAADRDSAFKWLDEGRRVHSAILLFLDAPELDPIRADPRFAALTAQLHQAGTTP